MDTSTLAAVGLLALQSSEGRLRRAFVSLLKEHCDSLLERNDTWVTLNVLNAALALLDEKDPSERSLRRIVQFALTWRESRSLKDVLRAWLACNEQERIYIGWHLKGWNGRPVRIRWSSLTEQIEELSAWDEEDLLQLVCVYDMPECIDPPEQGIAPLVDGVALPKRYLIDYLLCVATCNADSHPLHEESFDYVIRTTAERVKGDERLLALGKIAQDVVDLNLCSSPEDYPYLDLIWSAAACMYPDACMRAARAIDVYAPRERLTRALFRQTGLFPAPTECARDPVGVLNALTGGLSAYKLPTLSYILAWCYDLPEAIRAAGGSWRALTPAQRGMILAQLAFPEDLSKSPWLNEGNRALLRAAFEGLDSYQSHELSFAFRQMHFVHKAHRRGVLPAEDARIRANLSTAMVEVADELGIVPKFELRHELSPGDVAGHVRLGANIFGSKPLCLPPCSDRRVCEEPVARALEQIIHLVDDPIALHTECSRYNDTFDQVRRYVGDERLGEIVKQSPPKWVFFLLIRGALSPSAIDEATVTRVSRALSPCERAVFASRLPEPKARLVDVPRGLTRFDIDFSLLDLRGYVPDDAIIVQPADPLLAEIEGESLPSAENQGVVALIQGYAESLRRGHLPHAATLLSCLVRRT